MTDLKARLEALAEKARDTSLHIADQLSAGTDLRNELVNALPEIITALPTAERVRELEGALAKAEARLRLAERYIAEGHNISGTLRAEQTIKMRHCADEAAAILAKIKENARGE